MMQRTKLGLVVCRVCISLLSCSCKIVASHRYNGLPGTRIGDVTASSLLRLTCLNWGAFLTRWRQSNHPLRHYFKDVRQCIAHTWSYILIYYSIVGTLINNNIDNEIMTKPVFDNQLNKHPYYTFMICTFEHEQLPKGCDLTYNDIKLR